MYDNYNDNEILWNLDQKLYHLIKYIDENLDWKLFNNIYQKLFFDLYQELNDIIDE